MPTPSPEEIIELLTENAQLKLANRRLEIENNALHNEVETAVRYGELADDEVDELKKEVALLKARDLPPALRPVIEPPENTVKPGFDIEPIREK